MKRSIYILFFSVCFVNRAAAQFEGNGLSFDGGNDMAVCSSVPSLFSNLATTDFTIEAWVKPTSAPFSRIFFAQPSTSNFVALSMSTGNVIYCYVIVGGTTYSIATSAGIVLNQWTHVAATYQAASHTIMVYFNGVLQSGSAGGSSSTGTNGLMVLGSRPGGAQYFPGSMDELRVWSEARSACQIQSNMNKSISGVQTNLVVNYVFNQGSAGGVNTGITNLPDISGGAFDGTLTNFALNGPTSNWVTSGATVTTTGNPAGTPGQWTGSSSTDYNTAANWCGNAVPLTTTDISVPSGTPFALHILSGNTGNANNVTLSGGILTVDNGGTLNLSGNVILSPSGSIDATGGTVNLSGTSAQSLATGFTTADLSVTGNSDKSLSGDVTITGNLNMSSGNLVLNTSDVILSNGATLTGGSALSYVKTNGTGSELVRRVGPVDGTVAFPVGNSGYNPAVMTNAGATDNFRVHVRDEVLDNGTSGSQVSNVTTYAINHTWDVEENVSGGSDACLTLQWGAGEENNPSFDYSHVFIAHYYGGEWHDDGYPFASMAPPATGSDPYYTTLCNIETFSPFTIGSSGGATPLPVQLSDISAVNDGARNHITWHSANETGLDHYETERSTDGIHFSYMNSVAVSGYAAGYSVYDDQPNDGLTYYRLRMVNADGTSQLSGTVHAFRKVGDSEMVLVYPNPVADELNIQLYGAMDKAEATLSDLAGKVIRDIDLPKGQATLSTTGMAPGTYFLEVKNNGHSQTIKVIKN